MIKQKSVSIVLLVLLLSASACFAQIDAAGKIKEYIKRLESKMSVARKAGDRKKVQMIQKMIEEQQTRLKKTEVAPSESQSAPEDKVADLEDKVADLKEDMNKALAELKGQVEKVKSDNSDAKVGAQVFFQWSKYSQGGTASTPNAFDVTRAYIDIKKKLDAGANARVTLDVSRINGAAKQNLFDYLKYAYVELPVAVPTLLQPIPYSLTAKVGLQHTVWIDWADKQLGLRFIAKSLLDNEGIMSSADFGLGALGKISVNGLPEVEYMATVLNGTGYATNESDGKKAVAFRANSTVYDAGDLGKVIVGAYANIESLTPSDLSFNGSNKQGGFSLGYQHDNGKVFYEYITGSKRNKKISGYSLGGTLDINKTFGVLPGVGLFARMDSYTPDTSGANNDKKKSFYGVTYDWGKDVKFALDMQNAQTGNGATTSIVYLHSMIQM